MEITLLYFEGCPHWKIADERLKLLAIERPEIMVRHQLVETPEQAVEVGFFGSPSLQMNGLDIFVEDGAHVGLACRRYPTPSGFDGAPTVNQLLSALAKA